MADRTDFHFRQKVTEAELDLAFELLEKVDRNLAADLGIYGIISGAAPTQHSPVPDLTIDLTAPARAYDNLGQRIFFGTGQVVDCSVDHAGIPTEVPVAGQERWIGVFLRFDRLLSDPRTDGNSSGGDRPPSNKLSTGRGSASSMIDRRIACWIQSASNIARAAQRCAVRSLPQPDSRPSWISRRRWKPTSEPTQAQTRRNTISVQQRTSTGSSGGRLWTVSVVPVSRQRCL